jgi:hypothetical protein
MVNDASGGADNNVDARPESAGLRIVRHSAVKDFNEEPDGLGHSGQFVRHLSGQLASRAQHQHRRGPSSPHLSGIRVALAVGHHEIQKPSDAGQSKRQRLAGPGPAPTNHVATGQDGRKGFGLDGRKVGDPARAQDVNNGRIESCRNPPGISREQQFLGGGVARCPVHVLFHERSRHGAVLDGDAPGG